jgi:hypothetical protein
MNSLSNIQFGISNFINYRIPSEFLSVGIKQLYGNTVISLKHISVTL